MADSLRVLIPGGAGFVGAWLTRELVQAGHQVIVVDPLHFSDEAKEFIGGDFEHFPMKWQVFFLEHGMPEVDVIVPLQGKIGSVDSVNDPGGFLKESVGTNVLLLNAIANMETKPLVVFVSSDLCYRADPLCLYSAYKRLVEWHLKIFREVYGLRYVILRMATGYGPWQRRDSVVNFFVRRALDGNTIPVYGEGRNRQAFIFAEDAARCVRMACEGQFATAVTYPLVGANHRIVEVAETVSGVLGGEVVRVEWPPLAKAVNVGDLPINLLPPSGWYPKVKLEEGIRMTAEWMRGFDEGTESS